MQSEELKRKAIAFDDLSPDESIGAFGGSGQWVELCTVRDLRALEAALTAAEPVPVAYRHTIHMELGQTDVEVNTSEKHPFGRPGVDYSPEYWITTEPLYAAPPAPSVAVKASPEALEQFTAYFVKNYPGPDTVIFDPKWHAPKIFRAAISALTAQVQDVAGPTFVPWGKVERTNDGDLAIYGATYHVRLANFTTGAASGLNVGDMFYRAAPAKQEG